MFTVKGNRAALQRHLKDLAWKHVPATRQVTTGRGQRVTRTIKVLQAPGWIDFPGAAQVAQLRRTGSSNRRKTVEVVYLITSAGYQTASPGTLAGWVQGHWRIENRLHYVRDTTLGEDGSQVRTGQAPRIMATCRNIAISLLRMAGWENIAAGLRHHAARPGQALKLALTCANATFPGPWVTGCAGAVGAIKSVPEAIRGTSGSA